MSSSNRGIPAEASRVRVSSPASVVRVTQRFDLPDPASAPGAGAISRHVLGVLAAERISTAVAVGYGPRKLVTPVADAIRRETLPLTITVREILRAQGGRYRSCVCTDPSRCPPDGIPFDPARHPVLAAMAAARPQVILSSREGLAETIAAAEGDEGDEGDEGESMRRATRDAEDRLGGSRGPE